MMERFYARSASDKTEDWPAWFVAERGNGLNITGRYTGAIFVSRAEAEALADEWNRDGPPKHS